MNFHINLLPQSHQKESTGQVIALPYPTLEKFKVSSFPPLRFLAHALQRINLLLEDELPVVYSPLYNNSMLGAGVKYNNKEFITHTTLNYKHSAVKTFDNFQKLFIFDLLLVFVLGLAKNWHLTLVLLASALILLYCADLLFNIYIIFRSFRINPEIKVTEKEVKSLFAIDLPTITILCPLYKETEILSQFVNSIDLLDYPKEKLQVLLLMEENDVETVMVAKNMLMPHNIQILLIPPSNPKTKPKALNYGLAHASGEYIVIYDAEDIPEINQLKKAVIAFSKAGEDVFCLQAKLNFYNPKQNILTRLFTAEYSTWFDLMLTGLYSINAPIPLGGTSNFFRRKDIVNIEGWDAFNVCEDCDLGLRLYKKGYRTAIFNSTTYEEANSNFNSWIRQRSHWIKGYMQAFFVHMRSPKGFFDSFSEPHFFTFLLVVGLKTLTLFINPLLWLLTLSYFVFRPELGHFIESLFPAPIYYLALVTMIIGNFIYLYNYMLGCAKRGYWHLIQYAYLIPIYWLMMSFAAWKALYQLLIKPHYWEKTQHGLHLQK